MIPLTPVVSSQIAAIGYDAARCELIVKFRAAEGGCEPVYCYDGVPPELAAGLIAAESPGAYFHRHIRNAGYSYRRLPTGDQLRFGLTASGTAMRLPDRASLPKMRVRVPVQRVWPRHRRWVKSHRCCVPDCRARDVDFAHLRSSTNAGTGQKPHDIFGVSLCRTHHEGSTASAPMPSATNTRSTSGHSPPNSPARAPIGRCAPR